MAEATTGVPAATEPELIAVGTPVEVRSRFVGSWSRGFEVADHRDGRYRIKRLSDGSVLPDEFDPRRSARSGAGTISGGTDRKPRLS